MGSFGIITIVIGCVNTLYKMRTSVTVGLLIFDQYTQAESCSQVLHGDGHCCTQLTNL